MSKNIMNFFSGKVRGVFFSLALIVLLASCMDNDDDFVTEPVQVAYVSVYHASPDAPDFDIIVDDRAINVNPFDYTSYSGYLNFFTGNRNIKFSAVNASNALIDTTFNFEQGKAYSLFAINRLSDLQALLVVDSAAAPGAGKAMVRFVHLSPDAPAFDVALAGQNGDPLFANNSFKQATPFQEIDADTYSFDIKNAGGSDVLLSADDVTLAAGRYYTIVTRGFKSPPAGNTNILSVEIL